MKKRIPGWVLAIVLLMMAGQVFQFALMGYLVTALLCYGIAGLILVMRALKALERRSKLGTWLRRILSILLCLVTLAAAGTWSLILGESKGLEGAACDYMVVLGAGVNGTVPSQSLRERLDAAYNYLTQNPNVICVVSGGQGSGENITEAQCMYNDLVNRGIPAERIWLEEQAENTLENLSFSLDVIESHTGLRPQWLGVVSSEYHLFRACGFAREVGVTPVGIPAVTRNPLLRANYYLREIVAVWYYMIRPSR